MKSRERRPEFLSELGLFAQSPALAEIPGGTADPAACAEATGSFEPLLSARLDGGSGAEARARVGDPRAEERSGPNEGGTPGRGKEGPVRVKSREEPEPRTRSSGAESRKAAGGKTREGAFLRARGAGGRLLRTLPRAGEGKSPRIPAGGPKEPGERAVKPPRETDSKAAVERSMRGARVRGKVHEPGSTQGKRDLFAKAVMEERLELKRDSSSRRSALPPESRADGKGLRVEGSGLKQAGGSGTHEPGRSLQGAHAEGGTGRGAREPKPAAGRKIPGGSRSQELKKRISPSFGPVRTGKSEKGERDTGGPAKRGSAAAREHRTSPSPARVGKSGAPGRNTLKGGREKPILAPSGVAVDGAGSPSAKGSVAGVKLSQMGPGRAGELVHQFVQKLTMAVRERLSEAHLTLRPPELGRVVMELQMDGRQLQLKVIVDNPQVRSLLQSSLPELQSTLRDRGLELGAFSVSVGHEDRSRDPGDTGRPAWRNRTLGGFKGAGEPVGRRWIPIRRLGEAWLGTGGVDCFV